MKPDDQIFALAPSRRLWLAYSGLICLLTWLCFGDLRHHLVETHDSQHFRDNARISDDWTYFFSAEKEQASGRLLYEFVSYLAFMVWGAHPGLYHLLTVAWHAAVSLFFARCCKATGCNLELSLTAGLLFLVNVAHFRGIHWLSSLNYVMALGFALLAVFCFSHRMYTGRRVWLIALYVSLILAALSHMASLMAWPFCLAWAWSRELNMSRALRDLLPFALPLGPILAVIFHFTSRETSTMDALQFYPSSVLADLGLGVTRSFLWLLSRLATTAHWLPLRSSERAPWELVVGIGLLVLAILLVRRQPHPVSGWAIWTVLMLVPFALLTDSILLVLHVGPSRYLYFASAGSSLVLAWGLQNLALRFGGQRAFAGALLALGAVSYISLKQAEGLTYYSEARSYLSSGNVRTGIEQMRKALDLAGSALYREDAYARLCLAELDQPEQGAATIAAARAEFPDHPVFAACDLVRRSMAKGDPDQAYRQLLALANTAEMAEIAGKAYFNIGKSFSAAGNYERASLAFGRSLHILPDRRNALEHLSIALTTSGQNQRAREVLQYLNRLFPERLSMRHRPSDADATR